MISTTFTKTTPDQFRTITNGIDDRLTIIRHELTGFYNITKMIKIVYDLKCKEAEAAGISAASPSDKRINDWFGAKSTKALIKDCAQDNLRFESVCYELKAGTHPDFHGTYVHKHLYDHFMMWLDCRYARRVSIILEKIHLEAQEKMKAKISYLEMENSSLMKELQAFRAETKAHFEQIASDNKETHTQNRELKNLAVDQHSDIRTLIRLTDQAKREKQHALIVAEDSRNQTLQLTEVAMQHQELVQKVLQEPALNPQQPSLVQGTAWYYRVNVNKSIDIILKVGQRKHVSKEGRRLVGWESLFDFNVYSSGVNYRRAAITAIKKYIAHNVTVENKKRQRVIEETPQIIEVYEKLRDAYLPLKEKKDAIVHTIEHTEDEMKEEKEEAMRRFEQAQENFTNWRHYMNLHNKQVREEYKAKVKSLKEEIKAYNKVNDDKRDATTEVAAIQAPKIFKTKADWMGNVKAPQLDDFIALVGETKEDWADIIDDKKFYDEELCKINERIEPLEKKYVAAKRQYDAIQKFTKHIEQHGMLQMEQVFTTSRFDVDLRPTDSQSVANESVATEVEVDGSPYTRRSMTGFTWHFNKFITFQELKKFLEKFDNEIKDNPIKIDDELTSVHLLDERIDYLKSEDEDDDYDRIIDKIVE